MRGRAAALIAALLVAGGAGAQPVEHTFVVVIDGIRASEGFDQPGQEALAPLVEALLPHGSLLGWMEIRGQTLTLPAHQVFLTGTYADCGNTPAMEGRTLLAPRAPTLFDAHRVQSGAGDERMWVVSNSPLVSDDMDHTLMPGWGPVASARRAIDYSYSAGDDWVWDRIDEALSAHEVDLMMVNLHRTDRMGHSGDWDGYLDTIHQAALDAAAFWDRLQADPVYRDNTLLLVTTDHGRHLDGVENGWISHGDECVGCRQVFLLALGPGIRQGYSSWAPCSFLDVAPTVAHLMGLELPYHRGRVLTEILEDGDGVDRGLGGRYDPALAGGGGWAVRTSERHDPALDDGQGMRGVTIELSLDGGETWTEHTPDGAGALQLAPFAWTDGETVLAGWQELAVQGDAWYLRVQRLGPEDDAWLDVFSRKMAGSGTPISNVGIAGDGEALWLLENNARNERIRAWASEDGGQTWSEEPDHYVYQRHFPRDMRPLLDGDERVVAFSAHVTMDEDPDEPNENTEIFVVRSEDGGDSWGEDLNVSLEPSASIQPRLARTADGVLHLVWADLAGGVFQLHHAASTDDGVTFSLPTPLTSAPAGAWEPALVADGDRLLVAWSGFTQRDASRIHLARVVDGALEGERVLGEPLGVARTPALLPLGDCQALVSWSEGDLAGPWALAQEIAAAGASPATSASGELDPVEVAADGGPASLALAITLAVGDDDLGVDGIELRCPDGFPPTGEATAELDGDVIGAVAEADGPTLWLALDEPVTADGSLLTVRFEVTAPDEPVEGVPLEVWVHHGLDDCPIAVGGELVLTATAGGGDDDDTTDSGDDDTDPGRDCDCRLVTGRPAGIAPLALILAWLVRDRRRRGR